LIDFSKQRRLSMIARTLLATAAGLAMIAGAAQALPLAPVASAQTDVIRVAGGCGPGWHRGPYGGCRPLYNCPPGFHTGPYGRHCFRNW
jgi:hypothetical protein